MSLLYTCIKCGYQWSSGSGFGTSNEEIQRQYAQEKSSFECPKCGVSQIYSIETKGVFRKKQYSEGSEQYVKKWEDCKYWL